VWLMAHVLRRCYGVRMTHVAARELRNDTAGLLRRVAAGEDVVITVRGKPVAQLLPLTSSRRRWLPSQDLRARLDSAQADAGLAADLERLAGDTMDDLRPLE
jgi:prevent-host-death family protein